MNLEKIKEILKQARETSQSPMMTEMFESFEQFIELYAQRKSVQGNQEEFTARLNASYKSLWDTFERVAAVHGLSRETIEQYLANPNNFSPEQWQNFETLKREITETPASSEASPKRMLKKQNKNKIRI